MSFNELYRRVRFRKRNPLRAHHVPRRQRRDVDEPRPNIDAALTTQGDDQSRGVG